MWVNADIASVLTHNSFLKMFFTKFLMIERYESHKTFLLFYGKIFLRMFCECKISIKLCYKKVTKKLQKSYKKVTKKLQKSYKKSYKKVTKKLQKSHKKVTKKLQKSYKKVTKELQKSYKKVIKIIVKKSC